jgi:hypothetical protein
MLHEAFVTMLRRHVKRGRMSEAQLQDLLIQKAHFDAQRPSIERDYRNLVVGFVNGQMHRSGRVHSLMAEARKTHPGRLVYFEPIGFKIL